MYARSEQRPRAGSRGCLVRFAAQFPASKTSDREQPSSPAVMNSGLAQRLLKCRYYVQRLVRFSLARAVLPDNGELQLRRLTGNVCR